MQTPEVLKRAGYLVWVLYANLDVRTTLGPSLPEFTLFRTGKVEATCMPQTSGVPKIIQSSLGIDRE